ncbi:MAG: YggT family protein [Thermodesulfobacteriota bacterium]
MPSTPNSFMTSLASLLNLALTVYMWLVIIRAVISWVNPNPYNPVVQFLGRITDPALNQIRRIFPLTLGGLDFSPVILILLLVFANDFVVFSLNWLAHGRPASGLAPIFIISLIRLTQGVLFAFLVIIIVRAVLSWISPDPYNPLVRLVYGATEPVLYPLRRRLPLVHRGYDLAPLALGLAVYLAIYVLGWAQGAVSLALP